MSAPDRQARISLEVRAIAQLDLPELRAQWQRRWGDTPKYRARDLLARHMAYRLQAEALGDLAAPARRRMAELAQKFTADRGFTPAAGPNLKPGSSLTREWGGKRHEVAVTNDGFAYQGEAFSSLSQVAGRITGAKWNGPLFFGLRPNAVKRS